MAKQEKHVENGVSDRLRLFIELRGQSIREFADETGVPYRTLQDYVAGKRRPGADHLIRMASVGIDINWLLTGDVRHAFEALFPDDIGRGSVVAADSRLVDLIWDEALKAADSYLERRAQKSTDLLSARQTFLVVGYYFRIIIATSAKMIDTIIQVQSTVGRDALFSELLTAGISPDLDDRLDAIIAAKSSDDPT